MSAPVIGIVTRKEAGKTFFPAFSVPKKYIQAVLKFGGIPLVLPIGLLPEHLPPVLDRLDGLILPGGGDIDPKYYHEEILDNFYEVDEERDLLEMELTRLVVEREMPFLGICRGIQIINVALGGTLIPHIPDRVPHNLPHAYIEGDAFEKYVHTVEIKADTQLAKIIPPGEIQVNSMHHQSAGEIAPGLVVTALAPDGVVEAVELPDHPFGLAVQWHPEWLYDTTPHARALFTALMEAAGRA